MRHNYYKFTRVISILLLLFCIYLNTAFGYRVIPEPPAPVEYDGIRFEAPAEKMGYVVAKDIKSGTLLWEKQVYDVNFDPVIEPDAQWVFINSLKLEGKELVVMNEKDERFVVNIDTARKEFAAFSGMLKTNMKRYPFLKFECKQDNCKPGNFRMYVFYERKNKFPSSLTGEHDLLAGADEELIKNAKAYYGASDCGYCSQVFMLSKGDNLKEVPSEDFYHYLAEQGNTLRVFSFRNVTIIEPVKR